MRKFSSFAFVGLFLILLSGEVLATKLVTYTFRGQTRAGALIDGNIIDLNRAYTLLLKDRGTARAKARAEALVPPIMVEFLQGEGDSMQAAMEGLDHVKMTLNRAGSADRLRSEGILFSDREVELRAPVLNPPSVLAIGLNYRAHIEEVGREMPQYPTVFSKHGSIIGPGETIMIPKVVKEPDYEAELAFVIGKRASRVPKERALEYVAGFMVSNDVSARDIQHQTSQWVLGKSPDTFSAMGPYLVLTDEVPDPHSLRITTRIGNELLQDSNTGDMLFTVPELIAHITQVLTLEPGTVVVTGTPSGVGAARKRFLKPGEIVTVEIEKLGELSNPVARE